MDTYNHADLFELVLKSLEAPKLEMTGHKMVLKVVNLAIEPCVFQQVIREFFADSKVEISADSAIVEKVVNAELLTDGLEDGGDRKKYLETMAGKILAKLAKTKNWGKSGGPDLSADYHKLD